ncbi:MAG: aminopeptidase [Bacteroidaceae bacterium]|nr:aminopeptidase [Bacteroidaceae bacterium]
MKKIFLSLLILMTAAGLSASDLTKKLEKIPSVKSIAELTSDVFPEKYALMVEQPLDWEHPEVGTFRHRVVLMHRGFDRPTVLVTEGYGAAYALAPAYQEELAKHLDANIVFVEHRYFLESTPEPCDWQHLTVKNAVCDLHDVRLLLGKVYKGKWLATGISKGGTTTMFYRAYFPDDVDLSVPYVGPVNTGVQDGRHEPFIAQQAGTALQRKAIEDFQLEMLKRKDAIMPLMEAYCAEKEYRFRVPLRHIYDYTVFEYAFTMWQWGYDVHSIPSLGASDTVLFDYLMKVCDPSYFAQGGEMFSFFVQAAKELGYYGYDILPFVPYLDVTSTKNYLAEVMLTPELQDLPYDGTANRHTLAFLEKEDVPMVFIYGENDPWSATGICQWLDFGKKQRMHLFVDPGGSHRSRIGTLPPTLQDEAWAIIDAYMK